MEKKIVEEDLYEDEDTQKDMYFSFMIGNEVYGIEIKYVNEVIGMQEITIIPDMPDFIKGVMNLRGRVIPIMDVRKRFKMETREYDDRTCVIVANIQEISIGMIVDQVSDVVNIQDKDIDPPPKLSQQQGRCFIQGMGKVNDGVMILLDLNKILHEEEIEQILPPSEGANGRMLE